MDQLINTNLLYQNRDFQTYLENNKTCEIKRQFCHHDLTHFLAVARIASIKTMEAGLNFSRDLIYTTALLHDIGRFVQYQDKTPHEIASHQLAIPLLISRRNSSAMVWEFLPSRSKIRPTTPFS